MSDKPKSVTAAQIARDLGVSRTAVSFVLNRSPLAKKISASMRQRILNRADELGYVPNELARSLRKQRSQVVGTIFPDLLADWAHRVLTGVYEVLDEHDYAPLIALDLWSVRRQHDELLSMLGRRVDGVIIISPRAENIPTYQTLCQRGVPLLFLGDALAETEEHHHVVWNEARATEVAMAHLIERGYGRIGCLYPDYPSMLHHQRLAAFEGALRAAGLEIRSEWMIGPPPGDDPAPELRRVFAGAGPRPDALFATTDILALIAWDVLEQLGLRVPNDVALMGLCDLPLSAGRGRSLGLSTVRQPQASMGREAARLMMTLIDEPDLEPQHRTIPGEELIIRNST